MADEMKNFKIDPAVSTVDTGTVTVDGVRLASEIHGAGEFPLVLVHGSWLAQRQ